MLHFNSTKEFYYENNKIIIKYLSDFIVNDERHKSIYNDTLKVLSSRNINDI